MTGISAINKKIHNMAATVAHANPLPNQVGGGLSKMMGGNGHSQAQQQHADSGVGPIANRKLTPQDFRVVRTLGTGAFASLSFFM